MRMPDRPVVKVKRIYDSREASDGYRILVDRLWPRGVKKDDAELACWAKDLAPSTELRKWFDHREDRFEEFRARYLRELAANIQLAIDLFNDADCPVVTLLYAVRSRTCNHAIVLQDYLTTVAMDDC